MTMLRLAFGFAAMTLVLIAGSPPLHAAFIDSNLAVSPATQTNGGGCYPVSIQPSLLDMLTLVDPEWAAVDVGAHLPPVSDPITVHGTVERAKVNETGDFPASHLTYDQNTFITVDAAEMGLVATGNVSPSHGVEAGTMEVELEYGKYPLFAWGGTGNRFTGVGRWIWDCGHPNPDPSGSCSVTTSQACNINNDCKPPVCPGCVSGETCGGTNFDYHSELHVPQAIAVSRMNQGYRFSKQVGAGRRAATRTDVWISSDLGGAGDLCPITHHPDTLDLLFAVQCFPLTQPIANVNASDFEFDIPLPPRPPESASLPPQVRVFDRTPRGMPKAHVTTTFVDGPTPVEHAVVHMSQPTSKGLPSSVGKTIIARWPFDSTPLTRLHVDVTAIEIVNPLKLATPVVAGKRRCSITTAQDCIAMPCPSGESCLTLGGLTPGWQMFLEVNGDWREAASLSTVQSPTLVAQRLGYDLALPATGSLHLHTSGKSLACLESQLYGRSLGGDLGLYGLTDGANCLADQSHNAGSIDVTFTGPDFGSGSGVASYVTQVPDGEGGHCSTTMSQLCVADADCPSGETCVETGGSFKLHYTISKL